MFYIDTIKAAHFETGFEFPEGYRAKNKNRRLQLLLKSAVTS